MSQCAEGFLFSSNHADLRKFLENKLKLKGVISLPYGIYSPYTNIKTSVLLFENSKGHHDSVYFALAENVDAEKNDLLEISEEFVNFKNGAREFSKGFLVGYKKITGGARWDAKMHTAELNIIGEIAQRLNYPVETLFEISTFHSGKRIEGKHEYPVIKGDVLFADKGTIGRLVLITKDKKIYKSKTHYIIIRPDTNKVDSLYLFSYLKSKFGLTQIEKYKTGATIPNLTKQALNSFQILLPSKTAQEKIAQNYSKLEKILFELETTTGHIRFLSEDIFSLDKSLDLAKKMLGEESEDILSKLPYPIALGFRKLKHEPSASLKVSRLLDLFEIILKYTTIIQISTLLRSSKITELKSFLKRCRIHQAPTDGNWLKLLSESKKLIDSDVPFQLKIDTANEDFLNLMEELLNLRNEVRHGATIADDYAKEILSIYEPKIYSLGKFIAPLSSFKLRKISNSRKRPDTYEHDILELMGDNPEFESRIIKIKSDLLADYVYLFHNQTNEIIPLTPFLVLSRCPLCRNIELFFYDKMDGENPKYVGYRNSHRPTFSDYSAAMKSLFD